jgi:D-sedoheptulose 7-phosphate isomerase
MVKDRIKASRALFKKLYNKAILSEIEGMAEEIVDRFQDGGKLLIAGNGGSASQAEHIAGEFVGKFCKDRAPLPAIALTGPSASVTAISNDYGYSDVFARQVRAFGQNGDVLLLLTTSGESENLINAAKMGYNMGMAVFALTGENVTELHPLCSSNIRVPSTDTPRIQECHILIGHIIAEIVEEELLGA